LSGPCFIAVALGVQIERRLDPAVTQQALDRLWLGLGIGTLRLRTGVPLQGGSCVPSSRTGHRDDPDVSLSANRLHQRNEGGGCEAHNPVENLRSRDGSLASYGDHPYRDDSRDVKRANTLGVRFVDGGRGTSTTSRQTVKVDCLRIGRFGPRVKRYI
jgi:hypothetical protein